MDVFKVSNVDIFGINFVVCIVTVALLESNNLYEYGKKDFKKGFWGRG